MEKKCVCVCECARVCVCVKGVTRLRECLDLAGNAALCSL